MQALYNLGARKMLVFDLGPIGCFPLVHNKIEGKVSCLEDLNTMITMFNGKLYYMLMDLTSLFDGTTLVVAQTYKLIYDMILNPFTYGKTSIKGNFTQAFFFFFPSIKYWRFL